MSNLINPNNNVPMYKQLAKILLSQIKNGQLKAGDKLPSEAVLIEKYKISRITVRKAISELIDDGRLIRSHGKGTFVTSPKPMYKANDRTGFTRCCILAGKTPVTQLLKAEIASPPFSIMDFLNLSENDKAVMTRRLRLVDDEPILVETNYYPLNFDFLLHENLDRSLLDLLESKYQIVIDNSIRTLEVCFPNTEEMRLLNVKQSTPLLLFKDQHKDSNGKPLFTSKQVYCSERLKFYL